MSACYQGDRTIDGPVVLKDGCPLASAAEVRRYSEHGLDWGCAAGPARQLAFALLLDHLGDTERAARLVIPFTERVVAELDNDWELDTSYLAQAVRRLEATLA
jgi:hypothetical protein